MSDLTTFRGLVRGFWNSSREELELAIAPEQAEDRLRAMIAPLSLFDRADPDRPLRGWVNRRGFAVTLPKAYQNSFDTRARGTWAMDGARLRVTVTYGAHPVVKAFMAVWLGFVGLFAVIAVPASLFSSMDVFGRLLFLVVPVVMAAAGLGLSAFGRYLARDEEATLRALIERALRGQK